MTEKLYAERDIMHLDEIGNHYSKHVQAMTAEGLHAKWAIAAELAFRDAEIERLKKAIKYATDYLDESELNSIGHRSKAHNELRYALSGQGESTNTHSDDIAVDRFAAIMKAKLAKKRAEGRGGWENKETCSAEHLSNLLIEHVWKGDPVDVANFCMMLHQRGELILCDMAIDRSTYLMDFVNSIVAAFESGHIDENKLTLSQLHQIARIHIKDEYGINTESIVTTWGIKIAEACGYGEK